MEVILLEKIANLGNLGDKVAVKAGYARNFLLPFGKATPATADSTPAARPAEPFDPAVAADLFELAEPFESAEPPATMALLRSFASASSSA